jgi:hypothetical protein
MELLANMSNISSLSVEVEDSDYRKHTAVRKNDTDAKTGCTDSGNKIKKSDNAGPWYASFEVFACCFHLFIEVFSYFYSSFFSVNGIFVHHCLFM